MKQTVSDHRAFLRASNWLAAAAALLLAAPISAAARAHASPAGPPSGAVSDGLRVLVVAHGETDVALLRELKLLGINTVVGNGTPKLPAALAAQAADLSYVAFLSVRDVERLENDDDYFREISSIAAVPSFAGFHYLDDGVEEGYTSPAAQERTYSALKRLFPGKLALYPLRLDLIASDPLFLDDYFRPEFTDLVVPYFYPVGGTTLGAYSYRDDWDAVLFRLLVGVRERTPHGKDVLPVLQAFQQDGFAVEGDFPRRQMDVYAGLWSGGRNVAAFAWLLTLSDAVPLSGIDRSPMLQGAFRRLFESLSPDEGPMPEDHDGRKGPPVRTVPQ